MKRIWKRSLVIIAVLANTIPGVSQSSVQLPNIVPPPADAAALGRYGDVPVNLEQGLPSINVPLYEIKTSRLSLPITLNYYASGIKVDDQASWVGLGWSLNAGGVITRTVRSKDDLNSFVYPQYVSSLPLADTLSSNNNDWYYMNNVSNGRYDIEPDYFFYNFSNYSGKYIFGQNAQPLIIDYRDPLQINYDTLSQSFTILDPKGNQYKFASAESTQSYSTSAGDFPSNQMTYISSWYLTNIISFDKSDTVTFQYTTDATLFQTFYNYSEGLGPTYTCDDGTPENGGIVHDGIDLLQSESFIYSNPLRLKEIDFKNGKASFFSSGPRTDNGEVKLDSIVVYNYNPASAAYQALKTIHLSYDYFSSSFPAQGYVPAASGYRLRLDSLQTIGNDGENGGQYKFQYDSTMLPVIGSNAKDLFNFYNGAVSNPTLVPTQTYLYGGVQFNIGAANRTTNANYIQAGVLKHIYYPTGGRTDFTYEPNSFTEEQYSTTNEPIISEAVGIPAGGFQMGAYGQTDTMYFTATNSTSTSYVVHISPYNESDVSRRPYVSFIDLTSGTTIFNQGVADPNNGLSETLAFYPVIGHRYQLIAEAYDDNKVTSSIVLNNYISDSTLAIESGGGLRVKQITDYDNTGRFARSDVYQYGAQGCGYGYLPSPYYQFNTFSQPESFYLGCDDGVGDGCAGTIYSRIIFSAYSVFDVFNLSSSPLSYPEVAKYQTDSLGNVLGKSVFDYSVYQTGVFPVTENPLDNGVYITNSWQDGLLLSQTDYAYASAQFIPVKKTINTYNTSGLAQGRGCKIGTQSSISGCYTSGPGGTMLYYAFDYPIYTGLSLPTSQTVYDYDQLDSTKYLVNTKLMNYDNLVHLQPTTIQDTLSNGAVQITVNRYPAEVDSISGLSTTEITAIDSLQSRHNLTALIQSLVTRNGQPVSLVRTDYQVWPSGLVLADSVEYQNGNFPIESRLQFFNYDVYGNILQDAKTADVNHSYVWDYRHVYPTAQVTNAAQSDVAYTSFEADGMGNWALSGGTVDPTQSITGRNSYQNGTITASGLNPVTTYIVSYWSQNGAYSVPGTISGYPVQGKTISFHTPGWTLYVHKVTGQSTITVNATGHIDELRLYPATAQMTTYTYDPLIGMTSQTDPGNRATYYEYDGLQRLHRVRDQDYNILKTIDYAYQAPAGCGSGCYSVAMQTFLGTTTLSYPVGVFDVNGKLLGNATSAAAYVPLWNNDTADARVGTLSLGSDSMHFTIAVNAGQTLPASVTGLRYFQVDLPWNVFDAARQFNGAYIDFGDGTGMRMPAVESDTPAVHPLNTVYYPSVDNVYTPPPYTPTYYYVHTYSDTTLKTITCYHNDAAENTDFDNVNNPAPGLAHLRNLRGYLPAHTNSIGGSCYQQASMTSLQGVLNWNAINSVRYFRLNDGDLGAHPCTNISYPQDFMAANKGLISIQTIWGNYFGSGDPSFRISRLKSNWNTYFTQLQNLSISEKDWNREDLTGLTQLRGFALVCSDADGGAEPGGPYTPLAPSEMDNVINQVAAGAGQSVSNGVIGLVAGGTNRTSASQASVNLLNSKGWKILIDGVTQLSQ
jgi:hypothetical protein